MLLVICSFPSLCGFQTWSPQSGAGTVPAQQCHATPGHGGEVSPWAEAKCVPHMLVFECTFVVGAGSGYHENTTNVSSSSCACPGDQIYPLTSMKVRSRLCLGTVGQGRQRWWTSSAGCVHQQTVSFLSVRRPWASCFGKPKPLTFGISGCTRFFSG